MNDFPLLVEFVSGTTLYREPETIPKLPIVQNGPPGTFVVFSDGRKVPLPTDQIVFADGSGGSARIGLGGMSFEEAPHLRREVRAILEVQLNDGRSAWDMQSDGSYVQRTGATRGTHELLIDRAERRHREATRLKRRRPRPIAAGQRE